MTIDYETCLAKLRELADWYSQNTANRNEATTRLQLIDELFFGCLGWSKRDDVELEEPHGREYADYTFSSSRRILIV